MTAFCSQNSTQYELYAPLSCDASGEGIVAFQAGAAFRMGAESREEFVEKFAPSEEYGYLLGHSTYFYSEDIGEPFKFVPPGYALDDITQILHFRSFNPAIDGCRLWWIEYGGRDVVLKWLRYDLPAGDNQLTDRDFDQLIDDGRYVFVCVMENPTLRLRLSHMRVSGLLAVAYRRTQIPPQDIGVGSFEFWGPPRRPEGHNLAMTFMPPITGFARQNICNGVAHPTSQTNAWVANPRDPAPQLKTNWVIPQIISKVPLMFDTDFDHAMETTLRGHPEAVMPFAAEHYRIKDGAVALLAEVKDNHQTLNTIEFDRSVETNELQLEVVKGHGDVPSAVFAMHCYE